MGEIAWRPSHEANLQWRQGGEGYSRIVKPNAPRCPLKRRSKREAPFPSAATTSGALPPVMAPPRAASGPQLHPTRAYNTDPQSNLSVQEFIKEQASQNSGSRRGLQAEGPHPTQSREELAGTIQDLRLQLARQQQQLAALQQEVLARVVVY